MAGSFFALDLFMWHRSILYSGAGIATILANTQIFYLPLVGHFFLREKQSPAFFIAVALALLGIVLLVQPDAPDHISPHYWWGILFGILCGATYAGYIFNLRFLKSAKDINLASGRLCVIC